MLQMITSQEAQASNGRDVLGEIDAGTINSVEDWVETSALLVTECLGEPFGRYFQLTITDLVDEDDITELARLGRELGKNLPDCVVERERINEPHPWFPGSSYFDLVLIYGG